MKEGIVMIYMEDMVITEQAQIANEIFRIKLSGHSIPKNARAGQFVHLQVPGHLLRRPISVCSIDRKKRVISLVYRISGKGTVKISRLPEGATVNVLGPLGNGFPIFDMEPGQKALLVGGGIGVPPLYELARQLRKRGINVTTILGFKTKHEVFYEREFSRIGSTFVTTDDGSFGEKGLVTDFIKIRNFPFDRLYACGPEPMLRALNEMFPGKNLYFSLEERMACGIGACYACVKRTGTGVVKVCTDGPVFHSGGIRL